MASITDEQRRQIISLLNSSDLDREQIAAKVGVSPGTVSAIKAHITMDTYGDKETEELIAASEATFGLERDLQLALRANIGQLEPGLEIIDGGKELTTDAGRLDITARDKSGAIVVIELKAGIAAPEALTQLLAYMGVVAQKEQKPVRGVLISGGFHPRIIFAARAVSNVQLRQYRFKFTFEAVE
jgi:RecB family endonuclease NucS